MSEESTACCEGCPEQKAGCCADKPKKEFREHPAPVSAQFTWQSGEQAIAYTATAGHVDIREDCGEPIGSFFCLSYVADDPQGGAQARPVTFAYNGGPGSASVPIN
ncbi:MAG: hypothetical protein KHY83_09230, partial [Coriobacteriia bacterium]|nr:hypothetical protein [Coriobacteriia bacterium]